MQMSSGDSVSMLFDAGPYFGPSAVCHVLVGRLLPSDVGRLVATGIHEFAIVATDTTWEPSDYQEQLAAARAPHAGVISGFNWYFLDDLDSFHSLLSAVDYSMSFGDGAGIICDDAAQAKVIIAMLLALRGLSRDDIDAKTGHLPGHVPDNLDDTRRKFEQQWRRELVCRCRSSVISGHSQLA
jgi:hypothetical protein